MHTVKMTKAIIPQPTGKEPSETLTIAYTFANECLVTDIAHFIYENKLKKQCGGVIHLRQPHGHLTGYMVYFFGGRQWLCPPTCEPWKDKQHLHKAILM